MKKILCFLTIIIVFLTGCNVDSIDYDILLQNVNESLLSSNISITSECSVIIGNPLATYTSSGSGVIFHEDEDYYYFLTNNHVTVLYDDYLNIKYSIEDYLDNEYLAIEIVYNDANYDLAVGKFEKTDVELSCATLAKTNPENYDVTITIGQPLGVKNTVTFGLVEGYTLVTTNDPEYVSNITFEVLRHTAYTTSGSSGGSVFNTDFELIAISYAGYTQSDEFVCSLAVPIEKVHKFLDDNVWDLINNEGVL